jgi:hypothetical protein
MSSGICVPKDVQLQFNQIRQDNKVRWMKLIINDQETIECIELGDMTSSFENDLNSVHSSASDSKPAYFVFRLDEQNQFGSQWLLIWFVPDSCKPRPKMLYSSTLDKVKKDLGPTYISGYYHASLQKELEFSNFSWETKEQKLKSNEDSMSHEEKIKREERDESCSFVDNHQTSTVRGVNFPVTDNLSSKMSELKSKSIEMLVVV